MNNLVTPETNEINNEIPSLLIPMASTKYVLPTVSVAEMAPYQAPQKRLAIVDKSSPDWYLGSFAWRGLMVPMISYELINGDALAPTTDESQIIVLNSTGVAANLPFLSFPTQGIPRLSRIATNEISENQEIETKAFEKMVVSVAGEIAIIPDIEELGRSVAELLGYSTAAP